MSIGVADFMAQDAHHPVAVAALHLAHHAPLQLHAAADARDRTARRCPARRRARTIPRTATCAGGSAMPRRSSSPCTRFRRRPSAVPASVRPRSQKRSCNSSASGSRDHVRAGRDTIAAPRVSGERGIAHLHLPFAGCSSPVPAFPESKASAPRARSGATAGSTGPVRACGRRRRARAASSRSRYRCGRCRRGSARTRRRLPASAFAQVPAGSRACVPGRCGTE